MDTRRPVDYPGASPGGTSADTDADRQRVGPATNSRAAARFAGHECVRAQGRRMRNGRGSPSQPDGHLYCFAAGCVADCQPWLKTEAGRATTPRRRGNKALRSLRWTRSTVPAQCDFVCGRHDRHCRPKSRPLRNAPTFKATPTSRLPLRQARHLQPSNIDFENRLAVDLLKKRAGGIEQFVVEDESRMIGSCALPLPLHKGMQAFPMVWLEDSVEGRVERILRDYVVDLCAEFMQVFGETAGLFRQRLLQSLANPQAPGRRTVPALQATCGRLPNRPQRRGGPARGW